MRSSRGVWTLCFLGTSLLAACGGSTTTETCDPACDADACQICVAGTCQSSCRASEVCDGNGNCVGPGECNPPCDESQCEICNGDFCESACAEDEECDGNGNCVNLHDCDPPCDPDACEVCNGEFCESTCDEAAGEICDGNGSCVEPGECDPPCDPDACEDCNGEFCESTCDEAAGEICDGNGSCVEPGECDPPCDPDACEDCIDGACVSTCTAGMVCDGNGNCVEPGECDPPCDTDACEDCIDGACVSTCEAEQCEVCNGAGGCESSCTGNEVCDGAGNCVDPGVCDPACDADACQHCVEGSCQSTCAADEECDGAGNCFDPSVCNPACDANACEHCVEGTCESTCTGDQICDGSGNCCIPETCESIEKECGRWIRPCAGLLECGDCSAGYHCDNSGTCVANCVPETCNSLGKDCGLWPDGCGLELNCGGCQTGYLCEDGVCTACQPNCSGLECGPDGCGGSCGNCGIDETCMDGYCMPSCTPDCQYKECGSDGCGGSCGSCSGRDTCVSGTCLGESWQCQEMGQCILNNCTSWPLAYSCVYPPHNCPSCVTNCTSHSDNATTLNRLWSVLQCLYNADCWPDNPRDWPGCVQLSCASEYDLCMDGCIADCDGRECGSNGCGGSCGSCGSGEVCNSGQCIPSCTPDCSGRECGPDPNCSISCGTCPPEESCNLSGICESEFWEVAPVLSASVPANGHFMLSWTYTWHDPLGVPESQFYLERSTTSASAGFAPESTLSRDTYNKMMYEDPGTYYYRIRAYDLGKYSEYSNVVTVQVDSSPCGQCPPNSTCDPDIPACICNDGYVPDPNFAYCMELGGPCDTVTTNGYCADGDLWVWCDVDWTGAGVLRSMSCAGATGSFCNAIEAGFGMCDCGSFGDGTLCTDLTVGSAYEYSVYCVDGWNLLAVDNCQGVTGHSSGFCSSFVSGVGFEAGCFCDECEFFDQYYGVCEGICSGSTCTYDEMSNSHTCR